MYTFEGGRFMGEGGLHTEGGMLAMRAGVHELDFS